MEFTINDKLVHVEKLPLKKYAELFAALQELPKHVNDFSNLSNDQIVAMVPKLVSECYPDIVRIVKVATNMEEADIDAMGLADFVRVIEAVLEINDYSYIYQTLKKMSARTRAQKSPETLASAGSGGQPTE